MSERRKVVLDQSGQTSKTQQHFKDECDINQILERFRETGVIDHIKTTQAQYGYAPAITFTEAMLTVATANENFMQLPADIRSAFKNDPALFLDAAADPEKRGLFEELGLLQPEPPIKPDEPPLAQPVVAAQPVPAPLAEPVPET